MQKTELKLEYNVLNEKKGVPVIIVAAGASLRMQGINKQLAELGGIPIIIRTLLKFENCQSISNIILVVRSEDLFQIQLLCEKYMITKLTDIVCGGESREESVLKGFSRLPDTADRVLIHDGARPFVSNEIIDSVVMALDKYSAVACGVKVTDTVKKVDSEGKVLNTVNRENLVLIQTPQGVKKEDYLKAVKGVDVASFTDDTSIMEAAGYEVLVVNGSYKNIKITTKEDLLTAQGFLSEELE